MKTFIIIGLLFSTSALLAQYNTQNLKLESSASVNQFVFESLQLYPIRANQTFISEHKNLGNYVTLKVALEKKKVAITEFSGGSVNTLYIENISSDTVMILSGEVVQGGKQDRVIAQDFILPPRSGKKDVSVFCVEHGRWQTKKGGDMSFQDYFSVSSSEVRKAATVNKNQQEVWKKVTETTEKNNASTLTGTLTALQNAGTFKQDLERYSKYFGKLFTNQFDVIGVIVVAGDKILGCDMFATHELFQKHYPNLLNSYATEAITSGKKASVPYTEVNDYLLSIIKDEAKQENEVKQKGTLMKNGEKKIHISTFN